MKKYRLTQLAEKKSMAVLVEIARDFLVIRASALAKEVTPGDITILIEDLYIDDRDELVLVCGVGICKAKEKIEWN